MPWECLPPRCGKYWDAGAYLQGNMCLLTSQFTWSTMKTEHHWSAQVQIFQPPNHLQSEWMLACDLTAKLLSYLSSTGWKVHWLWNRAGHASTIHLYSKSSKHVLFVQHTSCTGPTGLVEQEASLEKPPGPSVSIAPVQEADAVRLRGGGRTKKRVRSQTEERIDSHAEASTSAAAPAHPVFKPGDHVEVSVRMNTYIMLSPWRCILADK